MKEIQPERVERVLVRGTNWVGDAVMSIPALREIRRIFSRAEISLLVRPWVKDVYSAVDFVDHLLELDKPGRHRGLPGLFRLAGELRSHRFDLAVLLQNAFEAAWIARLASIPSRIGYARDGRGFLLTHPCKVDRAVRAVHQAYYYLDILAGVGLLGRGLWRQAGYRLDIKIGLLERDRMTAWDILRSLGAREHQALIGINPGASYGGAKRWLPERYARVADALSERYQAKILLFGSAAERRLAEEISALMRSVPIILSGRTTLGQLMAMIKQCRLFITNDSGPMHLAAALAVPQIAIFGSTSEVATGPLSDSAVVLREAVECSPCFLRECPIDLRCMKRITVERVLEVAERMLAGEF